VKFKSVRAGTIPEMIKVTGCCLGFQKKATRLAEDTSAYISQLERKNSSPVEKTSVYLETYSPFKTCGSFTFADDIIKLAGAKNVASDTKGSVIISPEKILEEKPDIIIYIKGFANYKEISSRSALKTLNAVKNKQIYGIDRYLLTAGADIRQSVRKIQKIIDTGKKKHNAIP
jgi:iron complex transport system substrate-binding protein